MQDTPQAVPLALAGSGASRRPGAVRPTTAVPLALAGSGASRRPGRGGQTYGRDGSAGRVYPTGGSATQPAAGHWARAALSPDGAWIAAELSGECEVPTVFLIRVADGDVVRANARPLDQNPEPEESRLLGWDGVRALVAMSQGGCGSTSDPGVRAVDPDTRAITELTDLASAGGITTDRVVPWHVG